MAIKYHCIDCGKEVERARIKRCGSCHVKYQWTLPKFRERVVYYLKTRVGPNKGKKFSGEHRKKLSISHTGILLGDKNPKWVGDKVTYFALHHWVNYHLGKVKECVYCGEEFKRIHWASISHHAKRDLSDYIPLCVKCHGSYDKKGGYVYAN